MQNKKKFELENIILLLIRNLVYLFAIFYFVGFILTLIGVGFEKWNPIKLYSDNMTGEILRYAPLSKLHLFGTDYYGYDLFSQIFAGLKTNFTFSLITTVVFVFFGTFFGVVLGYYQKNIFEFNKFIQLKNDNKIPIKSINGVWNSLNLVLKNTLRNFAYNNYQQGIINRIIYFLNSFPLLLLILLTTIFLDGIISSTNIKLAIEMALFGLFSSPRLSAMIIGRIKALRSEEFIQAAVALGLPDKKIIWKHILFKECRYIILFQAMYMMGQATIIEITLTYFNYGANYPWISWGKVLTDMKGTPPHVYILFPVLCITLTIYMYMRFAVDIKEIEEKRKML